MLIVPSAEVDSKAAGQYHSGYIWLISLVAALGGLLFGYDWVVIGGAKPFFERYFHLTNESAEGWANSCALLGCLSGALLAGGTVRPFRAEMPAVGGRPSFRGDFAGQRAGAGFALFIAWRMLGGVAIGLASNLSPMYIAEVAPAQARGKLVSINQLTIVIGILLAQFVNWRIAGLQPCPTRRQQGADRNSWDGQTGWRWMFGVTAVPSLLFLSACCSCPESPRWLAKNGQPDRGARRAGQNRRRRLCQCRPGRDRGHTGERNPEGQLPRTVGAAG